MSLHAQKMRVKLEKLAVARERFEEKCKTLDADMAQGRSNMIRITRGLRNKEIVDGAIEISYSPEKTQQKTYHKKIVKHVTTTDFGDGSIESLQQMVVVPSGPRVSDWCFVGSYDSNPPIVKSNTVYETVRFLARGAFGDVNLVKSIEDSRLYAIKTIFAERESEMKEMLREVRFLRMNRHACIIEVYDGFIISNPKMLYIVMPYCEGGDLDGYIKNTRKNKTNIPEEKILKWSMQIGLAIHFLAENGLIHSDLKPNNIMLLEGGDLVKVVDFGLAVDMLDTRGNAPVEAGTPYYMAPEILQGVKYTYPVDCWSFGVMLHEMLRLDLPFRGKSTADLVRSILEDAPPPVPAHYSSGIKAIATALLIKEPQQRMGMAGMLMHPLLQPRTLAFPTSYRPKAVEERIRRNQVRQLNAQMELMPRSRHSSLIGIDHIISTEQPPGEVPFTARSATLTLSDAMRESSPATGTRAVGTEGSTTGTEEHNNNAVDIMNEEMNEEEEEEGDGEGGGGSRKRQELNAALQAAEVLAKADEQPTEEQPTEQPPPPNQNQMNEGDEEEEEEGW